MKLLLDTPSVKSGQTTDHTIVAAQEVHNFLSDRWIVLKFLQDFLKDVFLGVALKSLLDYPNVCQTTNQTTVPTQQVLNSWSDRWLCSNVTRSLRRLFSLASTRYRYTTPPTFGRARPSTSLEYRLNRSITLDPTIGSCSNFYKSCRRLFS